jgi:hypothetical protein
MQIKALPRRLFGLTGTKRMHLTDRFVDKCTTLCEHGAQLLPDCSCQCSYGFQGKNCEQLALRDAFTDPSCGIISDTKEGTITLNSYPHPAPKSTFCQWLIKSQPSETIEFEFIELDLNHKNALPKQSCADNLMVFGASGIESP